MREVSCKDISNAVEKLCIDANKELPESVSSWIYNACKAEEKGIAKSIMNDINENISAAKELDIPICQDTGMAIIFLEIGQDVHIIEGSLEDAVNKGVASGYTNGLLRKSIVKDPLDRVNTEDNTPAIIHTKIIDGDKIKITVDRKSVV